MLLFFIIVLGIYLVLVAILMLGWVKVTCRTFSSSNEPRTISIVVPFRNEASNLNELIKSFELLNYPKTCFEVWLVNDHSEDDSAQLIQSLIQDRPNYHLLDLPGNLLGKKQAISLGVRSARGEIIATTDADCTVPPEWLMRINHSFRDERVRMVFGGVKIVAANSFFGELQALEFASLIGSGAASIGLGYFTMCNGANLAFRKSTFEAVNGYEGNMDIPSGDDEFLARKILSRYPRSIEFLNYRDSVVATAAMPSVKDFIHQRLRWSGKWKHNTFLLPRLLAVTVLVLQFLFFVLVISLFIAGSDLFTTGCLVLVKIILDGIFLYSVSRFLGLRWSYLSLLALQFIYPLYVVGIGIVSLGSGYDWKGRSLSHKM